VTAAKSARNRKSVANRKSARTDRIASTVLIQIPPTHGNPSAPTPDCKSALIYPADPVGRREGQERIYSRQQSERRNSKPRRNHTLPHGFEFFPQVIASRAVLAARIPHRIPT
jgi:hypothetical protein